MELLSATLLVKQDSDLDCSPLNSPSASQHFVALALDDGTLHVFSATDGSRLLVIQDPQAQPIWWHAIVNDLVLAGSSDGVLRICRVGTGQILHEIVAPAPDDSSPMPITTSTQPRPHTSLRGWMTCFCVVTAGEHTPVLVASRTGDVFLWEQGSSSYSRTYSGGHTERLCGMAAMLEADQFVSCSYDGSVQCWNISDAQVRWKWKLDKRIFSFVVVDDKDIVVLACGDEAGYVTLLGLEHGDCLAIVKAHDQLINGLIYDDGLLYSTAIDGYAKVWDLSQGPGSVQLVASEKLHDHAITARCVINGWLVTAGKDGGGEKDTCGLNKRLRAWRTRGEHAGHIHDTGYPVPMIWGIARIGSSDRCAVAIMRKGKPMLEIWKVNS